VPKSIPMTFLLMSLYPLPSDSIQYTHHVS
jgi:hypothetical protein